MICKTKHSFLYSRIEFKNESIHIGRTCLRCNFKDYISKKDLPDDINVSDLPLKLTKKRKKLIEKQSEFKEKQTKTITRKKDVKIEVVTITKVIEKPVYIKNTFNSQNNKSFYDSESWIRLRYKVLQHYGRKCMCCGAENVEIHVDHIKPRSLYPKLELEFNNLQVLCKACNLGKSNTDQTDFRPYAKL